jgi:hypothetical protein
MRAAHFHSSRGKTARREAQHPVDTHIVAGGVATVSGAVPADIVGVVVLLPRGVGIVLGQVLVAVGPGGSGGGGGAEEAEEEVVRELHFRCLRGVAG